MIDCSKVAEQLLEYIDKEVDEVTRKQIEKHMELCRACWDVAEFQEMMRKMMREKTFHSCPDKVRKRISKIIDQF